MRSLVFAFTWLILGLPAWSLESGQGRFHLCSRLFSSQTDQARDNQMVNRYQSQRLEAEINRSQQRNFIVPGELIINARRMKHIFEGDWQVEVTASGQKEIRLAGGMHTPAAVERFLRFRPDYASELNESPQLSRRFSNGVRQILIPENIFSRFESAAPERIRVGGKQSSYGLKSIFPSQWSNDHILSAIREVTRDARQNPNQVTTRGPFKYHSAVVGGVKVTVVFTIQGGIPIIHSAFPATRQPQ